MEPLNAAQTRTQWFLRSFVLYEEGYCGHPPAITTITRKPYNPIQQPIGLNHSFIQHLISGKRFISL